MNQEVKYPPLASKVVPTPASVTASNTTRITKHEEVVVITRQQPTITLEMDLETAKYLRALTGNVCAGDHEPIMRINLRLYNVLQKSLMNAGLPSSHFWSREDVFVNTTSVRADAKL